MRILYIVPYVPSLIRVRPFNLIRQLHARGHHVTVATIWTNDQERQELEALARHCSAVKAVFLAPWRSLANCGRALFSGEPLQARYSWSSDLMAEINSIRHDVDVVHIEHLRGAQYHVDPRSRLGATLPVVWDSVDCISDLFEQAIRHRRDRVGRWINRVELSRTRAYEGSAVSRFDRVLVTSANDKAALQALSSAVRRAGGGPPSRPGQATRGASRDTIAVLSNGVDLDYFRPAQDERDPHTLVFSGKLSYHANETAVRHLLTAIMPRVWAARPGVRLVLAGKDPSRDLCRLSANWASRVEITGTVPDVRPYLRRAALAVAPLVYGVGCQNKVLEAMACGTPVVATSRAVGALAARSGRDAVVADGAEAFADAVLGLLDDQQQRLEIGRAGRAYVEAHHQWDRIAARLATLYEDVLAERRGGHLERAAG
jgi:glycosyltransferase involved in cell wall biosynthesis